MKKLLIITLLTIALGGIITFLHFFKSWLQGKRQYGRLSLTGPLAYTLLLTCYITYFQSLY